LLAVLAILGSAGLSAQSYESTPPGVWSLRKGWSIFTEYSPDSTHIFLGISQDREFVAAGLAWHYRLALNRVWELSWTPQVRPFMAESDPARIADKYNICVFIGETVTQPCTPISGYGKIVPKDPVVSPAQRSIDESGAVDGQPYYEDYTYYYGRRWTYVGGLSPIAFQGVFLPRSPIQPLLEIAGGFAVSPRDIPVFDTSSFNFTLSFGGGIRFWTTPTHATELEFRVQHLSNGYLGTNNDPGVDSRVIHLSYLWGSR